MDKKLILFLFFFFVVSTLLGWVINETYEDWSMEKKFDGLWIENRTYTEARDTAFELDGRGDWVCVNVLNMNYDEAVSTCKHETGHEIWAEFCENNIDKCIEITK